MKYDIKPWTRFGRLVTTWETKSVKLEKWSTRVYEKCICDCWNERRIIRAALKKPRWTRSCWCIQKEKARNRFLSHGMTKSEIYSIYNWIKTRCYNPNDKNYHNYGWRWIKCLWNSFEQFYEEMWSSYEEHVKKYWKVNTN